MNLSPQIIFQLILVAVMSRLLHSFRVIARGRFVTGVSTQRAGICRGFGRSSKFVQFSSVSSDSGSIETEVSGEPASNESKESEAIFNEFSSLGLIPDIAKGLAAQDIVTPTGVQKAVIPRLLNRENLVMAASTGSGKTLAFTLPAIQNMLLQEQLGYERQPRRPRTLVLVPTRELAKQVLSVVKGLSHTAKISSCAVFGGEQYSVQKKNLDRMVDVVIGSPGRLMQHKKQGSIFLSQVDNIIIDEVDTMLMQGFGGDIRAILRSVMMNKSRKLAVSEKKVENYIANSIEDFEIGLLDNNNLDNKKLKNKVMVNNQPLQLVMATATLTKAVRSLLEDVEGGFNIEYADPDNKTPKREDGSEYRVNMKIVEVDGVNRALGNVRHYVEESKGGDKMVILNSLLQRHGMKDFRTMIFCNSMNSTQAVQYALNEGGIEALSYHGDLNSKERSANVDAFRQGKTQYLVCTDLAARGLDIKEIDHIIMFDFPLNPVDYLHRAGRCGRAGRKGIVTSIIAKRDKILSDAVQGAIARGLPLDTLSSSKRDYQDGSKLASVMGRKTTVPKKQGKRLSELDRGGSSSSRGRGREKSKSSVSSKSSSGRR